MTPPRSTYRLQFRNGMDFGRARQLVPYLAALGVTHLYASPLMTAVAGSTHGYDATRTDEIDPALGGLDGLRSLAGDLHRHGIGLILDIVPNHMAASLENPWWRSVVVWGKESPFSRHFDIDWSEPLTLPFLGKDFAGELADGTLCLALDPQHDALALRYGESFYPLAPESYAMALGGFAGTVLPARPEENPQGAGLLARTLAPPGAREELERHLAALSREPGRIEAVHAAQPWRLMDWKAASRHLSYRRFFEIAGLAGLRVEDPPIFEESHRLVLALVREGAVDGLRIDHVDGLADPRGYLERLRAAVGPDVPILVEKILEKDEPFATDWPVDGTTGYEFIASLADALVDETEGGRLAGAFQPLKSEEHRGTFHDEKRASKRQMLADNFQGEVRRVALLAKAMANAAHADYSRSTLTEAICAMIVALPVYRTYMATTAEISGRDREVLAAVRREAQEGVRPEVREAIDFIWELLTDDRTCNAMPECVEFRTRFQQLSGPVMAKALEDTLFYRENAFIALNEVGGDPGRPTGGPGAFHAAMQARQEAMPHGLSATATHDTKRGEDARARLYTLGEAPDVWIAAERRWAARNARHRRRHQGRPVPEPDVEWLVYQSLAGAWPPEGLEDRAAFAERMRHYVEKALREAKTASNWVLPDTGYEQKVIDFVEDLLGDTDFCADFTETLRPFIDAGLMNSLAQTLIKLTAPGIPDIYQGSERGDFSLVDPDNRRPLDPAVLAVPQKPRPSRATFTDYKQWLVAAVLAERNRAGGNPFAGAYISLEISDGSRGALAFLRAAPEAFAITVVPRLTFGRIAPEGLRLSAGALEDVVLHLPAGFAGRDVRSVLDGRTYPLRPEMPLADILGTEPVALLVGA